MIEENIVKEEMEIEEVVHKGKRFAVDSHGFLLHIEDWSKEWVDYVREQEGIHMLTPGHEKIVTFIRKYYAKNKIAPMVRVLSKQTGFKLKDIYEMFPSGPGRGACRMAGLPKPHGCV